MTAISESDTVTLQVADVTKHYDSGFTLDDVTFNLPKGYIMGLIGPSGVGKSALIKLILDMIHRDAGSIYVLGLDDIANEGLVREQLGVVFDFSYMHELQQAKNTEHTVALLCPSWDGGCYRKYLGVFGLDDVQNGEKHIRDLSCGMRMKLMLAIVLSHDIKPLILDEPTSGFDMLTRNELIDILHVYTEDGKHSVLFSTHITADLEHAVDFTAYIANGRPYYIGPKDESEESFRLIKGGPDELAQLPVDIVLGSHTYAIGFDALVRLDRLDAITSVVSGFAVKSAPIDDIIQLTDAHDSSRNLSGR